MVERFTAHGKSQRSYYLTTSGYLFKVRSGKNVVVGRMTEVSFCDKFNKLTSVFHASVLLLTINCVITLSKWLWNQKHHASGSAVNFDNVITQFITNKRTNKNQGFNGILIPLKP